MPQQQVLVEAQAAQELWEVPELVKADVATTTCAGGTSPRIEGGATYS